MAVNRYFRRTPYDVGMYTPPIDMIKETMQYAQKQYDTNYAIASELKNHFIEALPQDRAAANEIQEKWNSKIDGIVQAYNGDYSRAGRDLSGLLSEIRREYNPGGKAAAISTNYKSYQEWLATQRDRVGKGKVLANQLSMANNYYMKNYQGVGEVDPVTGTYNQLSPEELADYGDPSKLIAEAHKLQHPEKRKVTKPVIGKDGFIYTVTEEAEGMSEQKLYDAYGSAVFSDPQTMTYLNQVAKFSGVEPAQVYSRMDAYVRESARANSWYNKTEGTTMEANPFALEDIKYQHDLNKIRYRQKLSDEADNRMLGNMSEALNRSTTYNRAFAGQKLDENWQTGGVWDNVKRGANKISDNGFVASILGGPAFTGVASAISDLTSRPGNKLKNENLYDALSSGKLSTERGVNGNLMLTVAADVAKRKGQDLSKMNEASRRTFFQLNEKDIIGNYNKGTENLQVTLTDEVAIPVQAGKVLSQQLLPELISNDMPVFTIDKNGVSQPMKFSSLNDGWFGKEDITKDDIVDKEGRIKSGVVISDYIIPGMGSQYGGYKVTIPSKGKSFYIVDQNKQRYEQFKQLGDAFSPIFSQGKSYGNPFVAGNTTTKDGKQVPTVLMPYVTYENNGAAYEEHVNFMQRTPQGWAPVGGNIYDVWNLQRDLVQGALPFGASSADNTRHILDEIYNGQDE